jgi:hypothetical protein
LNSGFDIYKAGIYHLKSTSSPFFHFGLGYFGDGDLKNHLPGLALNLDPPDLISASQVAGITGVSHWLPTC